MCGIAGIHVLDVEASAHLDLSRLAGNLLLAIDHRGGDATGAGCFGPDVVAVQKASCRARGFLSEWRGVPDGVRTVLLHTRFATQGKAAFPENNHPVAHGPVYVVHNGHISNDGDLFNEYGKERTGYVDSEAIPASIVHAGWAKASAGLERLRGSFAVAAVNAKHPGELVLAKGGWSPLVYVSNGKVLVWASEGTAIREAWAKTFGGSAPSRLASMLTGDILRVQGDKLTSGRFQVYAEPNRSYTYWTPNTSVEVSCEVRPRPTFGEVVTRKALDLTQTLADIGRNNPADVRVWSGKGWAPHNEADENALAEVRCAWCAGWTDPLVCEEWLGDLVCPPCHLELRAELAWK